MGLTTSFAKFTSISRSRAFAGRADAGVRAYFLFEKGVARPREEPPTTLFRNVLGICMDCDAELRSIAKSRSARSSSGSTGAAVMGRRRWISTTGAQATQPDGSSRRRASTWATRSAKPA